MKTFRELDSLVAEKVMRWTVINHPNIGVTEAITEDGESLIIGKDFKPTISITDAWQAVDKLKIAIIPQDDSAPPNMKYLAEIDDTPFERDLYQEFSSTAPLAICKLAIKYVEKEVEWRDSLR